MTVEWANKKTPGEFFAIGDIIHGQISVFKPIDMIIKSSPFQRLRKLGQLNFAHLVYPSANHTRFPHSLGVYNLARNMVNHFRHENPELGITSIDLLCVSIAGLIHDIGHGPFSHFYERFLKAMGVEGFTHEKMSGQIFDYMYENDADLQMALDKYLTEEDRLFIKELIYPPNPLLNENDEWQPKGRGREKAFLYEIVSNPHTGLDVDKIDYILRDSAHTNVGIELTENDWQRILNNSFVLKHPTENRNCIAYSPKVVDLIKKVFHGRMKLHKVVYKHKTTMAVEMPMLKVLTLANNHLTFDGDNGKKYKMTNAFENIPAFLKMDNSILDGILHIINFIAEDKKHADLLRAQAILQKIDNRELPKLITTFNIKQLPLDRQKYADKIKTTIQERCDAKWAQALDEHITVLIVSLDQGQGISRSPLSKIVIVEDGLTKFYKRHESGGVLRAYVYVSSEKRDELKGPVLEAVTHVDPLLLTGGGAKRKRGPFFEDLKTEEDENGKRVRIEEEEESGNSSGWEHLEYTGESE